MTRKIKDTISFDNVDMEEAFAYVKRVFTDEETRQKYAADPIGELRKIGINFDPNSEDAKKLLESAAEFKNWSSNLADKPSPQAYCIYERTPDGKVAQACRWWGNA